MSVTPEEIETDVVDSSAIAALLNTVPDEAVAEVRAEEHSEIDRLDPESTPMVLRSGTEFSIQPLKLRQFLRLLRIITRGASDVLDTTSLDFDDSQAFVQTLLGIVLFSVPEAEEETVDFLRSIVSPRKLTGDPRKDLLATQELLAELENPDLEDTVTIIQALIESEAEDMRALGKRLSRMFQTAQKLGATSPRS